ncbi:hypothetical protein CSPX01_05849 [Colletotrichum filicis]|nr:hypothetical protein CSPX01_05849 [Colletotrichum filicis]
MSGSIFRTTARSPAAGTKYLPTLLVVLMRTDGLRWLVARQGMGSKAGAHTVDRLGWTTRYWCELGWFPATVTRLCTYLHPALPLTDSSRSSQAPTLLKQLERGNFGVALIEAQKAESGVPIHSSTVFVWIQTTCFSSQGFGTNGVARAHRSLHSLKQRLQVDNNAGSAQLQQAAEVNPPALVIPRGLRAESWNVATDLNHLSLDGEPPPRPRTHRVAGERRDATMIGPEFPSNGLFEWLETHDFCSCLMVSCLSCTIRVGEKASRLFQGTQTLSQSEGKRPGLRDTPHAAYANLPLPSPGIYY